MNLYRVITTIDGHEYSDWYNANTDVDAINLAREEANSNGIPSDAVMVAKKCDPETLKPCAS